ncbi:hypothetical protein COU91_01950 [Candidatus Saccharibacteria bacterium CG10_big_fil_rev_8_21_14_0_10_47_8]|nr:MAG: hypothetical protein COU91_01950 [Candidatus Saccharibacteria bacterium CG10_big_fil_rev_8_21_14_0_10_47_8]
MPGHEQLPQDSHKQPLDFIVPFDGFQPEVDSRERELVSEKFRALVEDTLLNNASQVAYFSSILGLEKDSLVLERRENEDVVWTLGVDSKTEERPPSDHWESAEEIRKSLSIQKNVKGFGRDMFNYRLGSDGIIRRYDIGDVYGKMEEEKQAGIGRAAFIDSGGTVQQLIDRAQQSIKKITEVSIPNARLVEVWA